MTLEEVSSLFWILLPYLNLGMIILDIDLFLKNALNFEVSSKDFRREPLTSLVLGLGLVLMSSVAALIIEAQLSGIEPVVALGVLLIAYLVLTQIK